MTDELDAALHTPFMRVWLTVTLHGDARDGMLACPSPEARAGYWTAIAALIGTSLSDEDFAALEAAFKNYVSLLEKVARIVGAA